MVEGLHEQLVETMACELEIPSLTQAATCPAKTKQNELYSFSISPNTCPETLVPLHC